MDAVRYYMALFTLVATPPALVHWLLVHPFVGFWRRLGPGHSYAVLLAALLGVGFFMFRLRDPLLAVEYGTEPGLWPLAATLYAAAAWIAIRVRKHLSFRAFLGLPELARDGRGGELLREGPYSVVRHPRYVAVMLGMAAWALFTNYLAMYVAVPVTALALWLVAVLEESELEDRFGDEYARYKAATPRFVPRLRRRTSVQ